MKPCANVPLSLWGHMLWDTHLMSPLCYGSFLPYLSSLHPCFPRSFQLCVFVLFFPSFLSFSKFISSTTPPPPTSQCDWAPTAAQDLAGGGSGLYLSNQLSSDSGTNPVGALL